MSFVQVDVAELATNADYFSSLPETNGTEPAIHLLSYHPDFETLLGPNVGADKLQDLSWQAFHEAGVYNKEDHSFYVTSNYRDGNINITVVSLEDSSVTSKKFDGLELPNGATKYFPPGSGDTIGPWQVYCDQGTMDSPSQLVAVDVDSGETKPLLTNFYGRDFASINDVRQHPETGDLWFTDATYGYLQDFRPEPSIARHVYRFEPETGRVQVVADGFIQPNGLEFSPDLKTLYVSDTGSSKENPTGPSTIYAFDIVDSRRLAGRRTFAFVDIGIPDGIHTDTEGNVWTAAGDGVHIFNPEGVLLGKIYLGEASNNFAFAPRRVFIFSNRRLWFLYNMNAEGREVCKDFGTCQ
jgi:gluconolactonase